MGHKNLHDRRNKPKIDPNPKPRPYRFPKVRFAALVTRAYRQMNFEKLKSRKLWAAVIAGILNTIGLAVGIDAGVVENLTQIIMVYIVGQGIDDHGSKAKLKALKFEEQRYNQESKAA